MKHVSARDAIEDQNKKVTLAQQLPVVSKDFMTELVKTFLTADIPLHKLHIPHVIQLFENLGQKMPLETAETAKTSKQRTRLFEVSTERLVYIHCHQ